MKDPHENALEGLDDRSRELTETLLARQRLFQRTRRLLSDANRTAFLFVLTPEKLPILETERAIESLRLSNIPVAGAIINRVMPPTDDSSFWAARRERQQRHLDDIEQRLSGVPLKRIPLFEDDIQGIDALVQLARMLKEV